MQSPLKVFPRFTRCYQSRWTVLLVTEFSLRVLTLTCVLPFRTTSQEYVQKHLDTPTAWGLHEMLLTHEAKVTFHIYSEKRKVLHKEMKFHNSIKAKPAGTGNYK